MEPTHPGLRRSLLVLSVSVGLATASHAAARPKATGDMARVFSPPAVVLNPEVEPNDTPATATPLSFHAPAAVASGSVFPAGDLDFYSFVAPENSRVWIFADSGGTQLPGANSRDTLLTLYAPDGTTVLEFDNDDGTGNGGDGTVETGMSSAIAGAALSLSGTYYVRVAGFHSGDAINPYTLYVLVTYGATRTEDEPNGSNTDATPLGPGPDTFGVRTALIGVPGDVDYYEVSANAGDTLFFAADADPDRNGGTDLAIEVVSSGGSILLSVDSSANSVGSAEASSFVIPDFGTYFLRVHQSAGTGTGNYDIAAALLPQYGDCVTTISSVLGSDSVDYPALHGAFENRLLKGGVPMQCDAAIGCPGIVDEAGLHEFDAYTFFQHSDDAGCVAVQIDAPGCSGANDIFVAAYEDSFDPDDLCAHYLGDTGSSPEPAGKLSFVTVPYHNYVIVVSEINAGSGCAGYKLVVTGTCPSGLVVDAHDATGVSSNLNGVLEPEETVVVEPRWRGLTGGPMTGDALFVGESGPSLRSARCVRGLRRTGRRRGRRLLRRGPGLLRGLRLRCASRGALGRVAVGNALDRCADVLVRARRSQLRRRAARRPLLSLHREHLPHHVTGGGDLRRLLPRRPGTAQADGGLRAEGDGEPGRVLPSARDGDLRRRAGVQSVRAVYRRALPARRRRRMRPRGGGWIVELLPGRTGPEAADGGVPAEDAPRVRVRSAGGRRDCSPTCPRRRRSRRSSRICSTAASPRGCGASKFCPTDPNLRKQMAPFLVKTFGLVLYGH